MKFFKKKPFFLCNSGKMPKFASDLNIMMYDK